MIKRVKLADRVLPTYCVGEEILNTASHILGLAGGIAALVLCLQKAAAHHGPTEVVGAALYGACLIVLYSISSLYHALRPGLGKKVMQIIDHCAIYFLIAGSYSVISLSAIRAHDPVLGWGMFALEWTLCLIATVLTAIDLRRYRVFSMTCYICMGWAIFPFMGTLYALLTPVGFWLLLSGGIAYTLGAILYGIGSRRKWFHSLFHLFVVLGSVLQFQAFYGYCL